MNRSFRNFLIVGTLLSVTSSGIAGTIDDALSDYTTMGASAFNAETGRLLWRSKTVAPDGTSRSCVTCHGTELTRGGRHVRTDEPIEPMAPSINSERLTKRRHFEKWFLRNCKWTLGRECTPQEKGDLLSYLRKQ